MLVFIDESGTHLQTGNSCVALVYIAVPNAQITDEVIIKAEAALRISNFHWAKQSWKVREKFFQNILHADFQVQAAILKNPFNGTKFEYVLKHLLVSKGVRNVIIDGKKPKSLEARLKKMLRDKGISVKKLRTANDQAFPGLRLADAFAGLIRTHWEEPDNQNADRIYRLAENKITAQLVGGQTTG